VLPARPNGRLLGTCIHEHLLKVRPLPGQWAD
jgi:hypothetical protein